MDIVDRLRLNLLLEKYYPDQPALESTRIILQWRRDREAFKEKRKQYPDRPLGQLLIDSECIPYHLIVYQMKDEDLTEFLTTEETEREKKIMLKDIARQINTSLNNMSFSGAFGTLMMILLGEENDKILLANMIKENGIQNEFAQRVYEALTFKITT